LRQGVSVNMPLKTRRKTAAIYAASRAWTASRFGAGPTYVNG
jgi:hypothetical protein